MSQQLADSIKAEFEGLTGLAVSAVYMPKGKSHSPTSLQRGTCGVYVFLTDTQCLKVGKAGGKSKARWNSHHYCLDETTPSTLPKSILRHKNVIKKFFPPEAHREIDVLSKISIQDWIKNNLSLIEFVIEDSGDKFALSLLEALAQYSLKPVYEGKIE
ncbi:hypothetical protein KP001_09915 [Geomonas subterranea]|uniref:GIY-YIG nuclease family protein n=1 Tax=Geomonas subterranea TaxID=2847989 RepID=A0ABX8LTI8_9BACT|nr:hypothetical protein [Geomonas subterranea]QXE92805.1 hypothetical protein KP001_09915 [Geomonas subterranea]QXM09092.1 hypothetical protein KP002_19360 [Geomonas subterranea]